MSTGRFVWHELSTPDVDASEAFYRELLGWETEMWKAGEMDYRMISVGGKPHGGFAKRRSGTSARRAACGARRARLPTEGVEAFP